MRAAVDTGSMHSLHELDTPLPTPPDEKKAVTIKRLSYVLGFLYSLFLIISAVLVNVTSALIDDPWTPIITIYVTVSGLIILCLMIIDIKLFTRRIRKQVETLRTRQEEYELESLRQLDEPIEENGRDSSINDRNARISFIPPELETIEHSYCFAQGRHAGSVYLKFGATVFALGSFVHAVLLVAMVHFSIVVDNGHCISTAGVVAALLECFFYCVQLFFVLHYSNLVITKHTTLARMGLLHIMAGNICLWASAVATETKIAYRVYYAVQKENNATNATDGPVPFKEECSPTATAYRIFDDYSMYLYPFSVEFNILVVGIFFMVWRNIGKCRHSTEEVQDFHHSLYAQNISGDVNSPHSLDFRVNCRNAMCGLFSSFFIIVILIAAIILSFVLGSINHEEIQRAGIIFVDSMNVFFHTVLLVVTVLAFYRTQALDVNKHPVPWLDDVLLYICVPAFFLETILTVIPTMTALHILKFLDTIIMSLQMMIQVAFIIDGLRRCSNSRKLRRTRPGREPVLLLLVTNVAMWFFYTFSFKPPESKDIRYVYYGKEVWLAIGHICTPIVMFFRFHSSVCIADFWSYAYKPGVESH